MHLRNPYNLLLTAYQKTILLHLLYNDWLHNIIIPQTVLDIMLQNRLFGMIIYGICLYLNFPNVMIIQSIAFD